MRVKVLETYCHMSSCAVQCVRIMTDFSVTFMHDFNHFYNKYITIIFQLCRRYIIVS